MFKNLENYYYYSYSETVDDLQTVNIVSPGKKKEDFTINLDNDVLSVSVGSYHDHFKLTSSVDQEQIEAEYEAGVLIITLPKKESKKIREIEIK